MSLYRRCDADSIEFQQESVNRGSGHCFSESLLKQEKV